MNDKIDLMVIDAHAMAYRAYYAMQQQNLRNPVTGQPTWAIYGFFRMLFKLLQDLSPELLVVAWDPPGKNFRYDLFPDYKATRKPTPEDLKSQVDEIQEILGHMKIPQLVVEGFEADDLMGSLAHRFGKKKKKVALITGDKDCYQLLNDHVFMLRASKGVSDFIRIDPEWVEKELSVRVDQIPDYMALVGDSSDNIPGAKGIGPKSAAALIQNHGGIQDLFKNLEQVSPAGLRSKLEQSREDVFLSYKLATIETKVSQIKELKIGEIKTPNIGTVENAKIFRDAGFNQLYDDVLKMSQSGSRTSADDQQKGEKSNQEYTLVQKEAQLKDAIRKLEQQGPIIALDTETSSLFPMSAKLVGISLCAKTGEAYYIAVSADDSMFAQSDALSIDRVQSLLNPFFQSPQKKFIGQNIKYDLIVLSQAGFHIPPVHFDTMIASYLINPNVRRHNLDDMALDLLGYETIKYEQVAGTGKNKKTLDQIPPEQITDYACEDADITLRLYEKLEPEINKENLDQINTELEIALIPVLMEMEVSGVAIDQKYFQKLSRSYSEKLGQLESSIHEHAGHSFNINSTKELQTILFEKLSLPKGKKTKTGYSTDQSVLEELRGLHPIVDQLLEHRKYSKLKSTYVDALPQLIHPQTGRIHTSFNQTIAATGRLSSNDPNLQNIPIREETGRAIRRGFVPFDGNELLSLDYSQIELRIMAHYSKDPGLIEAFTRNDVDIHKRTAASLFHVTEEEVDPDMRSKAKVVNFSIIYGVTDYGLSRNLGITKNEAASYIERFFHRYPGVKTYMEETIEFARKNGYVLTLSGRRRQVPEINSSNRFRKEGAERTAINTPIQGTSADIIKKAMIEIHSELIGRNLKSKMILQVHDELVFDVFPEEKDEVCAIAKEKMESTMELSVPLTVDYRFGKNWQEAH